MHPTPLIIGVYWEGERGAIIADVNPSLSTIWFPILFEEHKNYLRKKFTFLNSKIFPYILFQIIIFFLSFYGWKVPIEEATKQLIFMRVSVRVYAYFSII